MKPKSVSGGDADPASGKSLQRSMLLPNNVPSQKDGNFASPAKTVSKSDLERESSDDESNSSVDLTGEVTVNGSLDPSESSNQFSSLNGHTTVDENVTESDILLNSEKLRIGSPNQSLLELSSETDKALGESEVD